MRRLFRSFERFGVDYLLTSGQAAILYGPEDPLEITRRIGLRRSPAALRRGILAEVARLQAADSAYWRGIIADLRRLHRAGRLLAEGTPVAQLLRTRRARGRRAREAR